MAVITQEEINILEKRERKEIDKEILESTSISIKPLRFVDIWSFAKLRNQIDREARHLVAGAGERKEKGLRILARLLLSRSRLHILIASEGRDMIGYISLVFARFKKLEGNAYLAIAIKEAYRGRGIGTKLMNRAESFARENGMRRMELEVFAKNTKAISLYERLGYKIEGIRRKAVKDEEGFDDMIFMAKFLDEN